MLRRGPRLYAGCAALAGACVAARELSAPNLATLERRPSVQLPPIGLGLWKSKPGEVHGAVKEALLYGCRLLDGAAAYANEPEVGAALAEAISERVVKRDEVWVVSKLFNTHHVWDSSCASRPAEALGKTLRDLGVEYIDLYMMHWPVAVQQEDLAPLGGLRLPDGTPNPKLKLKLEFLETWRAMLELKKAGKIRHLGVCNFTVEQLEDLLRHFPDSRDRPEVNQVELHPYLAQRELVAFCKQQGIALMAYSPLGSGDSYSGASYPAVGTGPFETPHGGAPLLQNALVQRIADRHGVTPAQVLISWSVAHGFCCLPKSVQPHRIASNMQAAASCQLSEADLAELAELDCGFRYGIGYLKGYFDCPNAPWFSGRAGSASGDSVYRSVKRWMAKQLGL